MSNETGAHALLTRWNAWLLIVALLNISFEPNAAAA